MILRDQQIRGTVAVKIERNHSSRIVQHDFVESHFGSHVAKALLAFVSEQDDPAVSRKILAYRDEVHPSVVVIIQCRHAPAAHPLQIRKRNSFK